MLTPIKLLCEYAADPLGIDTALPRLSWALQSAPQTSPRNQAQTAYQLFAASSLEALAGGPDLWQSPKVSAASHSALYAGSPLGSGQRVYWKVRVWDTADAAGDWSQPACFETGLLHPSDWSAQWIGLQAMWNGRALYLRKAFPLDQPVTRARAYVAGLGYYELRLNGQKVGDHVLDPGATNYAKRVLYAAYDITAQLQVGENMLAAIVGNGWYGSPKLLLQLQIELADGRQRRIISGWQKDEPSWQATIGALGENSVYGGEMYDARLERPGWDCPGGENPAAPAPDAPLPPWVMAMVVDAPGGKLAAQMVEPIRVVETLPSRAVSQPRPQTRVFDFGQNFAGWARLRLKGARGDRLTLRFAESLYPDGTVNQENLRAAAATDTYILRGEAEESWEPRFTYHGFRYVQADWSPAGAALDADRTLDLEGRVVRSSVQPAGSFECSNELLNQINKMVWWTEASNLHSIPTDCPQRDERMGWMNDLGARCEEMIYNFNLARFLPKFANDISEAQDERGAIPDTVPYHWGFRPADPVSVSYLLLPWLAYQHYGDRRVLSEHYNGFRRWVDFLTSLAEGCIVSHSSWGDWAPPLGETLTDEHGESPVARHTPGALISTGYYYYSARLLAQIAWVLSNHEDAVAYSALAEKINHAYQQRFWNEGLGGYGSNNQACNAFSLYLGLVPEQRKGRVFANLLRDIEAHDWHLTTGNLCTKYLLEVLSDYQRADVAYRLATQTTYPSWGYMLANGATTVWERWEKMTGGGMNSHNHPMLASVGSWFYKYLAGINVMPGAPGFTHLHLQPHFVPDLKWVRASLETLPGRVEVAWEREPDGVALCLSIPAGVQATLRLPGDPSTRIVEEGKLVWQDGQWAGCLDNLMDGILEARQEDAYVHFTLASGSYAFLMSAQ